MVARVEHIGDCTLYLGDCLELLPTLGKFDAVVTDPPYGVLDEAWDDMSKRELARFTMQWVGAASSLSETAMIFFGERTRDVIQPILYSAYEDVRQLIWNKMGGSVAEDRCFYSYESIYFCHQRQSWQTVEPKSLRFGTLLRAARERAGYSRGAVDVLTRGKKTGLCYRWEEGCCLPTPEQLLIIRSNLPVGPDFEEALQDALGQRDVTVAAARAETTARAARSCDVFSVPVPAQKRHPTEKPVPLLTQMLELIDGQTILDPFMGSGTTGLACARLGRSFTGIEQNPDYFDIACECIRKAYAQPDMFVPAPAKAVQEAMPL